MRKFVEDGYPNRAIISLGLKLAYQALKYDLYKLSPKQIISLGNFIYGASKFPTVVEGLYVEFGFKYADGDASFSEKVYLTFTLSEDNFRWMHKVYSYEAGVGSDSSEMSSYEHSVSGYIESHNAYEIMDIENDINEYINLGAEYYFEDLSTLSMEELGAEEEGDEEE